VTGCKSGHLSNSFPNAAFIASSFPDASGDGGWDFDVKMNIKCRQQTDPAGVVMKTFIGRAWTLEVEFFTYPVLGRHS